MKRLVFLLLSLGWVSMAAGAAESVSSVVALDGSGMFRSIQEAINAAPQLTTAAETWTIRIKPGVYRELIYVMREKRFIRLVGDDAAGTRIVGGLYAGMPGADGQPIGTFRTPTLWIDADDFAVENLTVVNDAGRVGQAVALRVDGDRVVFRGCQFRGWQDTLLSNRGRHYFENCLIAGAVDFIFGGGTAFFEACDLVCEGDGFITAASTLPYDDYGFVFARCRIRGGTPAVRTFLGRPWRAFAAVMFIDTHMSEVISPEGWHNWDRPDRERTARFVEIGSLGPGASPARRVAWARTAAVHEAAGPVTAESVLGGRDHWSPARK